LKGSVLVSFEKDYELKLQQMSGKVTRMMGEVQYVCWKTNYKVFVC